MSLKQSIDASKSILDEAERRLRTYWLLGLPFDCVSLEAATRLVVEAARARKRLLFCTPNVNFLAEAVRDPEFRSHLLDSGMSLADGMPVVWIGRWLGIPFPERVAGSALMERLMSIQSTAPVRVFFFGGEAGVAQRASEALEARAVSLSSAGHLFPAHGTAEHLSSSENIAAINSARADVLVVALGAKKGHRWLHINWNRLNVTVASHLGAVVNFVAGTVTRAPRFLQRIGAEWLWRVKEEPRLARRYLSDGLTLGRLFITSALPTKLWLLRHRLYGAPCVIRCRAAESASMEVAVSGPVLCSNVPELELAIAKSLRAGVTRVSLDLSECTFLSPRAIGWIYALQETSRGSASVAVNGINASAARSLRIQRATSLLNERPVDTRNH